MLRLWERFGDWIIFAALVIAAVVIILSWNDPMVKGFRARALGLTGTVENAFAVAGSYLRALEENESLRSENIRLSGQLARSTERVREADRLQQMLDLEDSLATDVVAARIVYKDILRERNTLTLDVGSADGVEVVMAVVEPRGILGKVVLVGEHFSQVMSYRNTEFFVPAKISPHQSDGIVRWNGQEEDLLVMDHVMKTDPVEVGQEVVTSGYSSIFRRGLPIGVIARVESPPGEPSWHVFVRPAAELADAYHAFVILDRPLPDRMPR